MTRIYRAVAREESAGGHQTQVLHLPQPYFLNLTLVGAWHSLQSQTAVLNSGPVEARRAQTKGVSCLQTRRKQRMGAVEEGQGRSQDWEQPSQAQP